MRIIFIPETSQSRTFEVSYRRLRVLYFYAEPGAINPSFVVKYLQKNLKNIETRYVGAGIHFIKEDHPNVIGRGIADWLRRLGG